MKEQEIKSIKKKSDNFDALLGLSIKKIRLMKGLSQEQAGECLNITSQQFQKYERGANRISATSLYKLANFFSIPVSYFFSSLDILNSEEDHNLSAITSYQLYSDHLSDNKQNFYIPPPSVEDKQAMLKLENDKLLFLFKKIKDVPIRRQILKLVESISESYS